MPVFSWAFARGQQPPQSRAPDPGVLQREGPIVSVQIEVPAALAQQLQQAGRPVPAPQAGRGLIDTGATLSAVDAGVVASLGIAQTGIASVGTPAGPAQQPVFPARIVVPSLGVTVETQSALGAQLAAQNLVALLGRDFLSRTLFVYNGPLGLLTLAF